MKYRIILSGYVIFKFVEFDSSLVATILVVLVIAKILPAFRLLRHDFQNSVVTDVFTSFRPPCLGQSGWAPTWLLRYKALKICVNHVVSPNISYTRKLQRPES